MIKFLSFLFVILSLTSCFSSNPEVKNEIVKSVKVQEIQPNIVKTESGITSSGEILPVNEKTTKAEQDFSNDLKGLLNLVDETSNEK